MKALSGSATRVVAAPIEQCFDLLEAVDRYPSWHPDVVREVEVLDRSGDGVATRARTTLHVVAGRVSKDFHLIMAVVTARPTTVTLTRLKHEPPDREEFEVRWRLASSGAGTRIELGIAANLSVPRVIPLGGIGDAMASGFIAAAARALGSP